MQRVYKCLLARRSDGKFLKLSTGFGYTDNSYVDDPTVAHQIFPRDESHFENPREATYYFESTERARSIWLKNCEMVPYEFTVTATPIPN